MVFSFNVTAVVATNFFYYYYLVAVRSDLWSFSLINKSYSFFFSENEEEIFLFGTY